MCDKFLVLGARGRVGSQIIKALPANVQVKAADVDMRAADLPGNVEPVSFDLTQPPEDWSAIFEDVRGMFLLWPPGVDVKKSVLPFIKAAAQHSVRQAVFLSILSADKLRIVPHRAVERALEASGMAWVFLRSAYFMQNLSGMHAQEIREQDEIFIPAGSGRLSMVDVRDVAAVGAKALLEGHANIAYELTGPEALSFKQLAEQLSAVLGRPIRYGNPAGLRFWRSMRQRGIPAGLVAFMLVEYAATRLHLSSRVTDGVERLLGRPATSFTAFAEQNLPAWQNT